MKTSKRLLSILLMLTMLLSMFTVMASADDPEDLCMHVDEEFNTTFTIFHEAATATCFKEGHVEYYECKMCPAEEFLMNASGKCVVQTNGVTKAKDPTNHGGNSQDSCRLRSRLARSKGNIRSITIVPAATSTLKMKTARIRSMATW